MIKKTEWNLNITAYLIYILKKIRCAGINIDGDKENAE
jgi:hypothetical protein